MIGAVGAVFVYLGPIGPGARPATVLSGAAFGTPAPFAFGSSVDIAPDVDGDGFNDILVGTYDNATAAYLYRGGTQIDTTADFAFGPQPPGGPGSYYGPQEALGLGDVNGDGYGDIAIRDYPTQVHIIWGSAAPNAQGARIFSSSDAYKAIAPLGSIDGDARADFALVTGFCFPGGCSTKAKIYLGRDAASSSWSYALTFGGGSAWICGGDVTGDGANDIVLSSASEDIHYPRVSRLDVYRGPVMSTTADYTLTTEFAGQVAVAGDLFGDGNNDILVGTQVVNVHTGPFFHVTLTDPTSADRWPAGALRTIRWTSDTPVDLAWVASDGSSVPIAQALDTGDRDSFVVRVPVLAGGTGRLEFTSSDPSLPGHLAGPWFTVLDTWWTVASPTGGETWLVGKPQTLRWSGTDSVDVAWRAEDGTTLSVSHSAGGAANNSLDVTAPHMPGGAAQLVFTPADPDATLGRQLSGWVMLRDAWWTIASPAAGATWPVGAVRRIAWSGSDYTTVSLVKDDGTTLAVTNQVGGNSVNGVDVRLPRLRTPRVRIQCTPVPPAPVSATAVGDWIAVSDTAWAISFTASALDSSGLGRRLAWSTYPPEHDVFGFTVDRRAPAGVWVRVNTVFGDSTLVDPLGRATSSYRLAVIDGLGLARTVAEVTGDPSLPDTTHTLAPFAYPSPCGASGCTIALGLASPLAAPATVRVFDMHGALVRTLTAAAGSVRAVVSWDARDDAGHPVASGIYEARIASGATTRRVRIPVVR